MSASTQIPFRDTFGSAIDVPVMASHLPPRLGKVLCVISDARLRSELEVALVRAGAVLLRAKDIWHATTLAAATLPDVVVAEIDTHSSMGNELFDGLRRNQNTASIPVMALVDSGYQDQAQRSDFRKAAAVMLSSSSMREILAGIEAVAHGMAHGKTTPAIRRIDPGVATLDAVFSEFGQRRSSLTAKRLRRNLKELAGPAEFASPTSEAKPSNSAEKTRHEAPLATPRRLRDIHRSDWLQGK